METQAAQALVRFGLGRRGAEPVPTDPAGWLTAQLHGPDTARIASTPSTAKGLDALRTDRERRKAAKATTAIPPGATTMAATQPDQPAPHPPVRLSRAVFEADARAELDNALTTKALLREHLVWFLSTTDRTQ
jgi:uncharacterized protein (DUF1800 family)